MLLPKLLLFTYYPQYSTHLAPIVPCERSRTIYYFSFILSAPNDRLQKVHPNPHLLCILFFTIRSYLQARLSTVPRTAISANFSEHFIQQRSSKNCTETCAHLRQTDTEKATNEYSFITSSAAQNGSYKSQNAETTVRAVLSMPQKIRELTSGGEDKEFAKRALHLYIPNGTIKCSLYLLIITNTRISQIFTAIQMVWIQVHSLYTYSQSSSNLACSAGSWKDAISCHMKSSFLHFRWKNKDILWFRFIFSSFLLFFRYLLSQRQILWIPTFNTFISYLRVV